MNDYGTPEERALGAEVVAREAARGLSPGAQRVLKRKMDKVNAGDHDVYL